VNSELLIWRVDRPRTDGPCGMCHVSDTLVGTSDMEPCDDEVELMEENPKKLGGCNF
jgi:hypothetical protein